MLQEYYARLTITEELCLQRDESETMSSISRLSSGLVLAFAVLVPQKAVHKINSIVKEPLTQNSLRAHYGMKAL